MDVGNGMGGKPAVYIRLDHRLSQALDRAAQGCDLSRAGWVRQQIVRGLPTHSDIGSLPPSPPRRPAVIPAEDLATVSKLTATLGQTGGAVVQLCRELRQHGHVAHSDAEKVLADLRSVQAHMTRLVHRLRP